MEYAFCFPSFLPHCTGLLIPVGNQIRLLVSHSVLKIKTTAWPGLCKSAFRWRFSCEFLRAIYISATQNPWASPQIKGAFAGSAPIMLHISSCIRALLQLSVGVENLFAPFSDYKPISRAHIVLYMENKVISRLLYWIFPVIMNIN